MRQIHSRLFVAFLWAVLACGSKAPPDSTSGETAQDRKAGLDALDPILASLAPGDPAGNTQRLVQSIKALPQFSDAGSSPDGTVWGKFKGGMLLFIIPLPPDEPPGTSVDSHSASAETVSSTVGGTATVRTPAPGFTAGPSRALFGTVPKSSRVQLFNGLGINFADKDPRPEILGMLQSNEYVGTLEDATVANLRTVSGDGIFYIRSHGGMAKDVNGADVSYALWTSSEVLDPAIEAQDAKLSDDLAQLRVVYMRFRNDYDGLFTKADFSRHYGITKKFVAQYMSFPDDSLVYVDACNSSMDLTGDTTFRTAFKNASVFVGWDAQTLLSVASKTAKYVFDRLLGANKFDPESPPQRPFVYEALERDAKFGPGKTYGYSASVLSDGKTPVIATLGFHPLGVGQFAMLAPGIFSLQAQEDTDELLLFGSFGPNPGADGKITIDDGGGEVALAISDWNADGTRITADLPRTGGGSSGNVVVTVRGHRSNTRQLLAWDGTFIHSVSGPGTLAQRFELDVRLRVDPHDVRDDPGAPPRANPVKTAGTNRNMAARFEASGTLSQSVADCTVTDVWTGTGSIPASIRSGTRSYLYSGLVDASRGLAQLAARAGDVAGGVNTETRACPPPIGTSTTTSPLFVSTALEVFYSGAFMLDMPLDAALNVTAGSRQKSQPPSNLTLQWEAMPARPAYDGTLPR